MSVLRVPVPISISEAIALASVIQKSRSLSDKGEFSEMQHRLAMSVAAEAKSKLFKALIDLDEDDPLKEASLYHAWMLDDSQSLEVES